MFSIQRNHLSDQGVDYITFGKGNKTLIIITGLSLQRLGDMSNLTIYSLFTHYFLDTLGSTRSIFLIERTISKKVFQLKIWLMTSTILYKNCILLMPLS